MSFFLLILFFLVAVSLFSIDCRKFFFRSLVLTVLGKSSLGVLLLLSVKYVLGGLGALDFGLSNEAFLPNISLSIASACALSFSRLASFSFLSFLDFFLSDDLGRLSEVPTPISFEVVITVEGIVPWSGLGLL